MDNYLLHSYGHSPTDKIKERITFALRHTRLYLAESDDERDDKSAAAKNSIYPVVAEDLALHYQTSMSLCWLLPM